MNDSDILSSSIESPILLAIEPKQRARAIMSALQNRDGEASILEVLDVQSNLASSGIKKVGFVSYENLAKQGKNRSFFKPDPGSNDGSNGVYVNLKSSYAEAIILNRYREQTSGGNGIVLYEPALQGTSFVDGLLGTSISQSFNGKTPDILMTVPRLERQIGTRTVTTVGKLTNLVDGGRLKNTPSGQTAPLSEITYSNTNLISPIEVTTSTKYKSILEKVGKFSIYTNLSGSINSYVPVLVMDEDVFNGFSRKAKVQLVDKMKEFGGFISLEKGLNVAAERKAIKAANWLEDGMNGRDLSSIQENENSIILTQIDKTTINAEQNSNGETPDYGASASSTKNLSTTTVESTEQANQPMPEESIASRRYQAIKILLEEEGMEEGKTSDWIKGILYTAAGTGLEKQDIKDIVEQIPGIPANQAANLVDGLSQRQM
jgi:hypothetical protein